jgi:hypothetical protein
MGYRWCGGYGARGSLRVGKKGGPSKFEWALELLSYARNQLKCQPQFVLFDSW